MEKLKKMRSSYRKHLTNDIKKINTLLESNEPGELVLKSLYVHLNSIYQQIESLNRKIVDEIIELDLEEEILDNELSDTGDYGHQYNMARFAVDKYLLVLLNKESVNETFINPGNKVLKYPKINVKKFDGDIKEWLSFWAQFKNIHEDPLISVSDKFQYLSQSIVKGSKAQRVIGSYPQSDENYNKAIEALQRRFGREDLLVEVYVRELLKLVIANNKGNNNKLSTMFDSLVSHLRALESLGVTSDKYACMLYPLVESSLPEDVLNAWQRSSAFRSIDSEENKLTVLMNFLRSEVEGDELIDLARDGFGFVDKNSIKEKKEDRSPDEGQFTAAGLHVSNTKFNNKRACILCEGIHDTNRCINAQTMTLQEIRRKISSTNVCFICFAQGHRANTCKTVVKCYFCSRRHNIIMCPDATVAKKFTPKKNKAGSKSNTTKHEIVSKLNEASSSTSTTLNYSDGDILLQTVIVNVLGAAGKKKVRLMLDSGAQRSYVSAELAKTIKANAIKKEKIEQTLFGGFTSGLLTVSLCEFVVEELSGKKRVTIQALNQEKICGRIPKLQKGPWLRELSRNGIWINDMEESCKEVDILIGADNYGKVMTGKSCKLKNGVIAFETIFGWTLLGQPGNCSSVSLIGSICDLWSLETIGVRDPAEHLTKQEKEDSANGYFQKIVSINEEGRYEVDLPWVIDKSILPSNRIVAEKRLVSTTKKLTRTQQLECKDRIFADWLCDDFIEEVSKTA